MWKKNNNSLLVVCFLFIPISIFADTANEETTTILNYNQADQKVLDNIPTIGCEAAYVVEPTTGKILYKKMHMRKCIQQVQLKY